MLDKRKPNQQPAKKNPVPFKPNQKPQRQNQNPNQNPNHSNPHNSENRY